MRFVRRGPAQLPLDPVLVALAEAPDRFARRGFAVASCAPAEDVRAMAYSTIGLIPDLQYDSERLSEEIEQGEALADRVRETWARELLIEQYLDTIRGDLYREMCDWVDHEPERKAARQAEWEAKQAQQKAEYEARTAQRSRKPVNPKRSK